MSAASLVYGYVRSSIDRPETRLREEPRFSASLDLVALPTAVNVARMFISDTLNRWHALCVEDHMEAVAAELVTLAVEATKPDDGTSWNDLTELNPITLRMFGYQRHIVFEVTDVHPEALRRPENLQQDSGLHLVDALANRWGSSMEPRGRVIWAELAV
ncbi:ATP-binding protein [Actinokineospora xionganensis]|uniref:ATP-binding protein n=1 Tax=Actinokineospora xionganensis TaxID=2684470 RepID=A0ABR7L3U7_9PSEU|nr:ATP-binding protein [Actinokineospora xionganensis]MBC6447355.1 ATP-binding protein [Actinokineospora xionganensis]